MKRIDVILMALAYLCLTSLVFGVGLWESAVGGNQNAYAMAILLWLVLNVVAMGVVAVLWEKRR